jgi:hypothetical protein
VTAYKLFRQKGDELHPLFVDADKGITPGRNYLRASAGELTPQGKVKSKIGPLAYRPGWHAGDLPIATHIGGKSKSGLTAPDYRPDDQVWAEIKMPNMVDWQRIANDRAEYSKAGNLIPRTAHITDQVPYGGHYRYKTNPNMTGEWLIGGDMKVNRVLDDAEVEEINRAAGVADLPRLGKLALPGAVGLGALAESNSTQASTGRPSGDEGFDIAPWATATLGALAGPLSVAGLALPRETPFEYAKRGLAGLGTLVSGGRLADAVEAVDRDPWDQGQVIRDAIVGDSPSATQGLFGDLAKWAWRLTDL